LGDYPLNGSAEAFWELEAKPFPYQELNVTVLVWHATCIRSGQFLILEARNGKNREQGLENRD
jgi:hypothetical protein